MSETRSRVCNQVFWSSIWIPLLLSVVRNLPFVLSTLTSGFVRGSGHLCEEVCSLKQGSPKWQPAACLYKWISLEYTQCLYLVNTRELNKNSFQLSDQWSDFIFKWAMTMSGPFQKDVAFLHCWVCLSVFFLRRSDDVNLMKSNLLGFSRMFKLW